MTRRFQQLLIAFFTFIGGLYFFLEFALPAELPLPEPIGAFHFGKYHDQISKGLQMIGVMAIGLGILNILQVHGGRVVRSRKGWGNSLVLLLGMFTMFVVEGTSIAGAEKDLQLVGALKSYQLFIERVQSDFIANNVSAAPRIDKLKVALQELTPRIEEPLLAGPQNEERSGEISSFRAQLAASVTQVDSYLSIVRNIEAERAASGTLSDETRARLETSSKEIAATFGKLQSELRPIFEEQRTDSVPVKTSRFMTEALWASLGAAMFSLLAFYIANAAYRSFRVRSFEALVMMLAAVDVMLGQIPFGPLYVSEYTPALRLWLLKNVNVPAFRAIYFGAAIAGLAMAIRMWLSLERSPLSAESKPKAPGKSARN